MVLRTEYRQYETRPLDCWQKAKELRLKHYQDLATAKEKGKLLVCGGGHAFPSLPAGLGEYEHLAGEPYAASIGADPSFSLQCLEAVEAQGFARDMCAYYRNYLGSELLSRFYFTGGQFPKPDFCIQLHVCDMHGKWYQQVTERFDIPYFPIDHLATPPGFEGEEARVKYVASQLYDAIEWMQKITGRKYDDEKLIEATNNDILSSTLWAEVALMNQAIPGTLDLKTMYSLYSLCIFMRYKKESVEFYRVLRDEIRDRVKNRIAALATERCRLLHDSEPPWSFLHLYRYLEKFGAVCIGSMYCFGLGGALREEGGVFVAAGIPKEGIPFKNRDEVVDFLARWYLMHFLSQYMHYPTIRSQTLKRMVEQWHGGGIVFHLNRGCPGTAVGQMENRLALLQAGIPVMTYEGSSADRRDVDERQTLDRVDAFMESLGLSKIPNT